MRSLFAAALLVAAPAAAEQMSARALVERAYSAMGGDAWANARTLRLEGRAVFYGEGPEPKSVAADYRMWRVFDPAHAAAHGAEGRVRLSPPKSDPGRADGEARPGSGWRAPGVGRARRGTG